MHGIPEAIAASKALKVYIGNLMTQPGETRDYTAADHLRSLEHHAGGRLFDRVILNTRELSRALRKRYGADRAEPVTNDLDAVRALGVEPVLADLLLEDHLARHDSRHLAQLLLDLAVERKEVEGAGSS